jgi:CBS domain-containing protein
VLVREIMTTEVTTLPLPATVAQALATLAAHRLANVPVVGIAGEVVAS